MPPSPPAGGGYGSINPNNQDGDPRERVKGYLKELFTNYERIYAEAVEQANANFLEENDQIHTLAKFLPIEMYASHFTDTHFGSPADQAAINESRDAAIGLINMAFPHMQISDKTKSEMVKVIADIYAMVAQKLTEDSVSFQFQSEIGALHKVPGLSILETAHDKLVSSGATYNILQIANIINKPSFDFGDDDSVRILELLPNLEALANDIRQLTAGHVQHLRGDFNTEEILIETVDLYHQTNKLREALSLENPQARKTALSIDENERLQTLANAITRLGAAQARRENSDSNNATEDSLIAAYTLQRALLNALSPKP